MKFKMERRQNSFDDLLRKHQRQIKMISKEVELHRKFLSLQFESFLDFLKQNGGQLIKNGKEEGMFFPIRKEQNGSFNREKDVQQHITEENGDNKKEMGNRDVEDDYQNDLNGGGEDEEEEEEEEDDGKQTAGIDEDDMGDDMMDPVPPPQAILGGSPSGVDCSDDNQESGGSSGRNINGNNYYHQRQNGSRHDAGQSSSRRSSNVVSSSDAHNGDVGEYEDGESGEEYEDNNSNGLVGQADMLKYVQNFMFSHFLDGGGGGGGNEYNGMDESYNDDEMGGYEGEDDEMDLVSPPRSYNSNPSRQRQSWSNNSNSLRNAAAASNLQQLAAKQVAGNSHNNLPIPASNIPHNERTCRYCGKTFHWKQSWVIHERTHTGEKPYLCKCGKAFSQKSNMNTHAKSCAQAMTTQKGKTTVFQMKCSHCQKMFTHKKNLDLHVEKFHPEILNLSVKPSTSSSSSPTSSSLQHHHHHHQSYQNGRDAEAAAAARTAAENAAILNILKTVSSQVAAAGNTQGKNLLTGQPPLSPPSGNESLSGGEDKNGRYPCSYCPKRFPVKGTLERHLRVHTGEKPFLCGICGKAFTQKGSVKLHLERVHRQTM